MKGEKDMLEFLITLLFIWLAVKVFGFLLPLAWGTAKVIGSMLLVLAVPVLFLCLLFAGGAVLFLPLILIGAAYGVLKICC